MRPSECTCVCPYPYVHLSEIPECPRESDIMDIPSVPDPDPDLDPDPNLDPDPDPDPVRIKQPGYLWCDKVSYVCQRPQGRTITRVTVRYTVSRSTLIRAGGSIIYMIMRCNNRILYFHGIAQQGKSSVRESKRIISQREQRKSSMRGSGTWSSAGAGGGICAP